MKLSITNLAATFLAVFGVSTALVRAEIPMKSGEKVAFLGDSITQGGQSSPGGYVQLVGSALAANGVKIEIIGAGIGGHKSNDMLKRLDNDVLGKKPQWMTLSCGVNDVWHGARGVVLEDYKKNITEIVDKAQAAGVKVVLLTSTMIKEDAANEENKKLAGYNDFLRTLAAEKKCLLADLNGDMQASIAASVKAGIKPTNGNYLTSDGVHMSPAGNQMMAVGVLKGFGLDAAQVAKAKEAWLDIPGTASISTKAALTFRQSKQLAEVAAKRKLSVDALVNEQVGKVIEGLLKGEAK